MKLNISINCDLQEQHDTQYKSKAATQLVKAMGKTQLLQDFDDLRSRLKNKKTTNEKITTSEREQYNTILAKLHTQLLSKKYKLKEEIKKIETETYFTQGNLPNTSSNTSLQTMHQDLHNVKKTITLWYKFKF